MHRLCHIAGTLVLILCCSTPMIAQDEDDEPRYLPGLLARYKTDQATLERIDSDIQFLRDSELPPASGLSAGAFAVRWSGGLFIRQPDAYTLHVFLEGGVELSIDGKRLLSGVCERAGWVSSEPVDLEYGEHALEVSFQSEESASRIQLFWSSPRIAREPIPAEALFRSDDGVDALARERGEVLLDALRCNRCHQPAGEPVSDPAPALTHLRGGLSGDWMIRWLSNPNDRPASSLMPDYGFTEDEARAIAAFLLSASDEADVPPSSAPGDEVEKDRRDGEVLFRTVGCIACHEMEGQGQAGLFGGGDLSTVGEKRSRAWLSTWLATPEKLNPDHRMPVFELTDRERRQLAVFLGVRGRGPGVGEDEGSRNPKPETRNPKAEGTRQPRDTQRLLEIGRELVESNRCAACHRIPGIEAPPPVASLLDGSKRDWSKSCLAEAPDKQRGRAVYRDVDREAVVRYVEKHPGGTGTLARFELGRQALRRRNCLACHPRGLEPGMVAVAGETAKVETSLQGEAQVLIPPSLTAVGDKLHESALKKAVLGEQAKRLPWLRVRMPKFPLTDRERDDLVFYLIAHDRIPTYEPRKDTSEEDNSGEQLIAGHELVGGKGFSCVSCHGVGSFEPAGVALGTRGSNLLGLDERMRREYFLRWTRAPLRMVPGVEMPSYNRPVPGLLDGDLELQLEAVWNALNDPNFTAPTNPDVVEQYLVVAPGQPARIVRDVFTMPTPPAHGHSSSTPSAGEGQGGGDVGDGSIAAPGFVPRAFAVGLNNGHNLLFDLDAFAVRHWWFGDFARQRTQGKTWLWETAGVPLGGDTSVPSGFLVVDRRNGKQETRIPPRQHATIGRLDSYTSHGDGVRVRYRLNLPGERILTITETFTPLAEREQTGWRRGVFAEEVPDGVEVYLLAPNALASTGGARVEPAGGASLWSDDLLEGVAELAGRRASRLKPDRTSGSASGAFHYLATLRPERLTPDNWEPLRAEQAEITSVPGYEGVRLPLSTGIMPTALTWLDDGTLAFCSLKGDVYLAHDTDADGLEDRLTLVEEGLAAPYGILAEGDSLLVSHKPEVLRLRDTDGDGRADRREVVATGWGFSDNYHDWTMALSRDSKGMLYVGLGSDYAQPGRPRETTRWRGKLLRIDPEGNVKPLAHALRYPTGIAVDSEDRVFISDNQGVGNTFNEINHLVEGHHYGVPSLYEEPTTAEADWPAIQVPHPWTRSVNGLFFLPEGTEHEPFAGHGIGCELNRRFLVRFTYEEVDGVVQGAVYPFSMELPDVSSSRGATGGSAASVGTEAQADKLPVAPGETFLGPIAGAVGPAGDVYVASLHDSGWLGGRNEGEVVRLRRRGAVPLGIRQIRATHRGFVIDFTASVDLKRAADVENYSISAYTRHWQGAYETPDSDRHRVEVRSVRVSPDGRSVELQVDQLRPRYVYDISCGAIGPNADVSLWPAIGHYTMRRVPKSNRTTN